MTRCKRCGRESGKQKILPFAGYCAYCGGHLRGIRAAFGRVWCACSRSVSYGLGDNMFFAVTFEIMMVVATLFIVLDVIAKL